jgi:hypothetical protein
MNCCLDFGTVLAVWYFGTVLAVWYFFVFHFLLELPRTCICVQIEQQLLFFSTVVTRTVPKYHTARTVPKSKQQFIERGDFIHLTHIYMTTHFIHLTHIYMTTHLYKVASFNELLFGFWNCSGSVVFWNCSGSVT